MNRTALSLLILSVAACSSGTVEPDGSPAGGSSSGGTGGATAGASGSSTSAGVGNQGGGGANAGAGAGGSGAAGSAGSGGTVAGGGQGAGGMSTAGAGGSSGSAGAGGSGGRVVKPSAGCAKQSAQVTIPNSRVGIPMGYTGKDPVPVVLAIHAAGNDNSSMENTFRSSDLAKKYLMVYPNSTSATSPNRTGWNMQADKNRFLEIQAAVLNEACVDENRIYATGHSSGAQFIVALLCSGDGAFDGVAPVASSVACQKWKNGPVPALIIHGVQDEERTKYNLNDGDGKKDLQPYLASNECTMTSTPFDPNLSSCSNTKGLNNTAFNDGCVTFSGCKAETRWCNHNDPNYGTTNHGIPCFGVRSIYDFFESL
ncbi:MAG: hypothetical protein K0R38_7441 [Polyangiaceae bacterium]|jgi:predicted esterase|nr:hypothetical protein [Polyangiaceae bacterium]